MEWWSGRKSRLDRSLEWHGRKAWQGKVSWHGVMNERSKDLTGHHAML